MSAEVCLILAIVVLLPWVMAIPLLVAVGFLILLPREHTRQVRHRLAEGVLWEWVTNSKFSARAHNWLWNEGNGRYDQKGERPGPEQD